MGKKKAEENFAKLNKNMGISKFFGIPLPDSLSDKSSLLDRFFGHNQQHWDQRVENEHDIEEDTDGSLLDNPFSMFGSRKLQPQ